MQDEHALTLRQIDQARGHLYGISDDLDFLKGQLARLPTRKDLARAALSIIFCTAVVTTLFVWIAWH